MANSARGDSSNDAKNVNSARAVDGPTHSVMMTAARRLRSLGRGDGMADVLAVRLASERAGVISPIAQRCPCDRNSMCPARPGGPSARGPWC